jgi:hypothetical protein
METGLTGCFRIYKTHPVIMENPVILSPTVSTNNSDRGIVARRAAESDADAIVALDVDRIG